jgi:ABC-type phosphate/phosphonate transport system substrate-binding protein
MPIANARMYSATPAGKAAWHRVLRWTLDRAALPWDIVDYDAPAPLSALWARDDLGLAMMCGLPFSQRQPPAQLVAAPIPSPAGYEGRAIYRTDIVVRADAPFRTLEDTFGGVAGYTLADSLSGGVAFNLHLQPFRAPQRPRLYARSVGGLVNARGVIEALAGGRIDVGPLDSWYHDQLRAQDPVLAARVRTIASTAWRPIPPLVATAPLATDELDRLREALLAVSEAPVLAADRALLLLAGFVVPPADAYAGLAHPGPLTAFEEL